MSLAVTRIRRPRSLDDLTAADRTALPIVAQALWGETWPLDEIWAMDDFGGSLAIWMFEEDGVVRYELWDGTGGCDGALIDCDGPRASGAGLVQHSLHNGSMDPAMFAAIEAAWNRRGDTVSAQS